MSRSWSGPVVLLASVSLAGLALPACGAFTSADADDPAAPLRADGGSAEADGGPNPGPSRDAESVADGGFDVDAAPPPYPRPPCSDAAVFCASFDRVAANEWYRPFESIDLNNGGKAQQDTARFLSGPGAFSVSPTAADDSRAILESPGLSTAVTTVYRFALYVTGSASVTERPNTTIASVHVEQGSDLEARVVLTGDQLGLDLWSSTLISGSARSAPFPIPVGRWLEVTFVSTTLTGTQNVSRKALVTVTGVGSATASDGTVIAPGASREVHVHLGAYNESGGSTGADLGLGFDDVHVMGSPDPL